MSKSSNQNLGKSKTTPPKIIGILLAALTSIGPFSIDTYLPSFIEIAETLGTSVELVQQTITSYLIGFGIMSLWHGSISDAIGRRKVIIVGMTIYMISSIGCALAQTIDQLIIFRMIQGLSAGSGIIVARAIVRDIYSGSEAQKIMAQITMLFALAPAIAPVIGGFIQIHFGWQFQFVFLALISLILVLLTAKYLPETLAKDKRQPFKFNNLIKGYLEVFKNLRFWFLTLSITLFFGGFFMNVLSAPQLLINILGLREDQFYIFFIPITLGMMLGAFISGKMSDKWSHRKTLHLAFVIMLIAGFLNLAYHIFFPAQLPWTILFIPIYTIGMSLAMPSVSIMILDINPTRRGMISSCQSLIQVIGAGFFAGVVAPLIWDQVLNLAFSMMVLSILSLIILYLASQQKVNI